jgi:hypothetical protein
MHAAIAELTGRAATVVILLMGLALTSCADDLKPSPAPPDSATVLPTVSSVRAGDVVTTTIDASYTDAWVYFDFEGDTQVMTPEASGGRAWDLGFQRFKVKSNGGVSGQADAEVAVLDGRTLDGVDGAPATGWLRDGPDGEDGNPDPDTVFNRGEDTWFSYDTSTHVLSAKPRVYVVRTADDGFFAVQMLRYYDDAGNPGFLQLRWRKVTAPAGRVPAAPVADAGAAPGD